jgi:hypothetical protein
VSRPLERGGTPQAGSAMMREETGLSTGLLVLRSGSFTPSAFSRLRSAPSRLDEQDLPQHRAARTSRATLSDMSWRVQLPLLRPALGAAALRVPSTSIRWRRRCLRSPRSTVMRMRGCLRSAGRSLPPVLLLLIVAGRREASPPGERGHFGAGCGDGLRNLARRSRYLRPIGLKNTCAGGLPLRLPWQR